MTRYISVKTLIFCCIILSVTAHATNSIGGNSVSLPKTTSVFSRLAKVVVIGLAFGAHFQAFASPFAQKHTHSLNKRQNNEGHLCIPNSDNIFYVGQNNFTDCLEQYPQGNFTFVERVNFEEFSQNEKDKYPLYNDSVPFSGSLNMFPYSFDNFNITRSEFAAFFHTINNAAVKANFTNVNMLGSLVGAFVAQLYGHNDIELEYDTILITLKQSSNVGLISIGSVIGTTKSESVNNILFKSKQYFNITFPSNVIGQGTFLALAEGRSMNMMHITVNEFFLKCLSRECGFINTFSQGGNFDVTYRGGTVMMDGKDRNEQSLIGAFGNMHITHVFIKLDLRIDRLIMIGNDARTAAVAAVIGTTGAVQLGAKKKIILISGTHVDIQGGTSNAIGIASAASLQEVPPFYLFSINGTLGTPHYVLAPQGSCRGSMIDWSGVHLNTTNLGCTGALELDTIRPEHWRQAHRLMAEERCEGKEDCFYVSEDLLALVRGKNNNFFLVTRQRYPQNNANDGQGVVHVTQYTLEDPAYAPILNTSFAINGTRLFTNETETLLPVTSPLSVSLTDDHQLLMLYGATGNLKVASMPLRATNDTTYTIHDVQSDATPVQMDNGIIWLNQQDNVLTYNISNGVAQAFSQESIVPSQANLVGAKRYQDRVYTAQIENNINLLITRLFNNGNPDLNWSYVLPLPSDYSTTPHQLNVEGNANDPIVSFPKVSELSRADFLNNVYLTVEIPPEGGRGKWRYGNESFTGTLQPPTEVPTLKSTTESNEGVGNMTTKSTPIDIMNSTDVTHDNGNAGAIAGGILAPVVIGGSTTAIIMIIVCHKKKSTLCKKIEKSDNTAL